MAYSKDKLARLYQTMCEVRCFEERVEKHFFEGRIPGFVHLSIGQEAISAGVGAELRPTDYIAATHRGHGHCLAKGADVNRMMAEIYGRKDGLCKGKGGSMHIADFEVGMLGANGVVGGGFNLAMGAALASKLKNHDDVAVVSFGDGASNRGTFHEAANMAAAWKLPLIFLCEMNEWASTTPYLTTTSVADISDRAAGYGMPRKIVDGNDVVAVNEGIQWAIDRARKGEGPSFLECKTYRIKGHFVGDPEMYRTKEEVQLRFSTTDPLKLFREKYTAEGIFTEQELKDIFAKAEKTIDDAVDYAEQSPFPEATSLFEDLYI